MNRDEVDDFLSRADDVIEDWEGSGDSASWSPDGSHEEAEIRGHYGDIGNNPFAGVGEWVGGYLRARLMGELAQYQDGCTCGFCERRREAMRGTNPDLVIYDEAARIGEWSTLGLTEGNGGPTFTADEYTGWSRMNYSSDRRWDRRRLEDQVRRYTEIETDARPAARDEILRLGWEISRSRERVGVREGEAMRLRQVYPVPEEMEALAGRRWPQPSRDAWPGQRHPAYDLFDVERMWELTQRARGREVQWYEPPRASTLREAYVGGDPDDMVEAPRRTLRIERVRKTTSAHTRRPRQVTFSVLVDDLGRCCGAIYQRDIEDRERIAPRLPRII